MPCWLVAWHDDVFYPTPHDDIDDLAIVGSRYSPRTLRRTSQRTRRKSATMALNRTAFSYCLDWVVIAIFLGIAGAFSFLEPAKRDFSLTDPAISFPSHKDTISIPVLFIVAIVVPAAIMALICVSLVRLKSPPGSPAHSTRHVWRRRLWELHAAWLGLALSLTLSLFLTQTLKNMFGKPRPDFLSRCKPNVGAMPSYVVGGYTSEMLEGTSQLVSWQICLNKDGPGRSAFLDGFRSFPSGHCTGMKLSPPLLLNLANLKTPVAFAGLTYLSLFLASKFTVTIPYLAPVSRDAVSPTRAASQRETAAAPPLHLLVFVFIPLGAAIYIASTRFTDYKHAGFDVLFGSVEGIVSAWFAFRLYHLPTRRGAGWAWGPRRRSAAFGIGTGVGTYGMAGRLGGRKSREGDVEQGAVREGRSADIELQDVEAPRTPEGGHAIPRALV